MATHRERRIDGVEDGDRGRDILPCVRLEIDSRAVRPMHLSASVFKARIGGNALGSPPSLVKVSLSLPGKRSVFPHAGGATGLGRDQDRSWQSGRSSRGRHDPPGSQRESGTGQRATGATVSDYVCTEV